MSNYYIGILHLFNHSIVKSILFIKSGDILDYLNYFNLRRINGYRYYYSLSNQILYFLIFALLYISLPITKDLFYSSFNIKYYILFLIFTSFNDNHLKLLILNDYPVYTCNDPWSKLNDQLLCILFILSFIHSFYNHYMNTIYLYIPFFFLLFPKVKMNIHLLRHIQNILDRWLPTARYIFYLLFSLFIRRCKLWYRS